MAIYLFMANYLFIWWFWVLNPATSHPLCSFLRQGFAELLRQNLNLQFSCLSIQKCSGNRPEPAHLVPHVFLKVITNVLSMSHNHLVVAVEVSFRKCFTFLVYFAFYLPFYLKQESTDLEKYFMFWWFYIDGF